MRVTNQTQYNQGISKAKLLSSAAGVGSIITTKLGYYVLISDINKWKFVKKILAAISDIRKNESESEWVKRSNSRIEDMGYQVVDDERFVEFLRIEQDLDNLITLVGIPHLSINEQFNTVKVSNNPIIARLKDKGENPFTEDFMVPGTHFPKWFKNGAGRLMRYDQWRKLWLDGNNELTLFAPPRDASYKLRFGGKPIKTKIKDKDGIIREYDLHQQLSQLNLILICPNGHLSDIPWERFLRWRTENPTGSDNGINLFELDPCCTSPDLKWTESTTRSEGYGSVYIECRSCGMGSGQNGMRKVNLEGINNLKPNCPGHKPWEVDHEETGPYPYDTSCTTLNGAREKMQQSLVTGNNVYFSNGFSSLYIPKHLAEGRSKELQEALRICEEKYNKTKGTRFEKPKDQWASEKIDEEFLFENGFEDLDEPDTFIQSIISSFLEQQDDAPDDRHEHYRWQEYFCFTRNSSIEEFGLSAADIATPSELADYFEKIQQIEDLQVSQVQLNFSRVRPSERMRDASGNIVPSDGKEIYSIEPNDLYVLPANRSMGEGIFIKFNEEKIRQWEVANSTEMSHRIARLINSGGTNDQGASLRQRLESNGPKHLLIHTFAHLLMRELEFSCGYPTASLKERLYISQRMSGLLIYTAEGSEGSMGGIVWQAQPERISKLIRDCLVRAEDCSSDPLCWESEGQGILNLNLAACFSCGLVSETACEEWNLALDRRMLVDPGLGYFKDLLL